MTRGFFNSSVLFSGNFGAYTLVRAIRLYSVKEKREALSRFKKGQHPKQVKEELPVALSTLTKWYGDYLSGDIAWALNEEPEYELRQKALVLFKEGLGYKKVAAALMISEDRAKFWGKQFKYGDESFFHQGRIKPKHYSKEFKERILRAYSETKDSKKVFCVKHKISTGTLNRWIKL